MAHAALWQIRVVGTNAPAQLQQCAPLFAACRRGSGGEIERQVAWPGEGYR
jgi:hypothetical protein